MRTARPFLRLLAAILRVAALVVLVPVLAQAHAGHGHAGPTESGHARSVGAERSVDAARIGVASAAVAADISADRAECLACPSCCCGHVFVAVPDAGTGRGDRPNGRRVAMGPDSAPPSAVPEAIPEPPRPFA